MTVDPSPPEGGYWLPRRWSAAAEPVETPDRLAALEADLRTSLEAAVRTSIDASLQSRVQAALQLALAIAAGAEDERRAALNDLRDAVERLEKQQSRSGKEQFKANALAEAQQKTVGTVLDQLKDAGAYRNREVAQLRERLARARDEGRLDLIKGLLPTLDGLDEALASGERMMAALHSAPPFRLSSSARRRTFGERWSLAARVLFGKDEPRAASLPSSQAPAAESVAAWLEGLGLVQNRLLQLLDAEDIRPIPTEGEEFDPRLHLAVEAVPVSNGFQPGFIVREARRGYRAGESVLRYAEVVVARGEDPRAAFHSDEG